MSNLNAVSIPYPFNFNKELKDITFNALFHLFPINFTWFDHEGNIIYCNQRVLDLFDSTDIKEFMGKPAIQITSSSVWENTKKVLETGCSIICEETHTTPKDKTFYFLSMKAPVKTHQGKVAGVVNIAIDITDRKMLELDLINAKRAAKLEQWNCI